MCVVVRVRFAGIVFFHTSLCLGAHWKQRKDKREQRRRDEVRGFVWHVGLPAAYLRFFDNESTGLLFQKVTEAKLLMADVSMWENH